MQQATRAQLEMILWALIVGASFPAVELISEELPPLLLTAIRFAIAALAIWLIVQRAPDRWPSLPALAVYSAMGLSHAAFFAAMFWAAHHATALSMAAIYVSVPLMAYCLGLGFRVEAATIRLLSILALGAIGALALAMAQNVGQLEGLRLGIGEAVFFLGCVGAALYPVLSKWGLRRGWLSQQAGLRAFWSLLAGGALIGTLGLVMETPVALVKMTLRDSLLVIYLGLFSSAITFWLMQRATGVLTPGTVTAYSYLTPFFSMFVLLFLEPQRIGLHWVPGSLMVLLAIALLLSPDAPKALAGPFRSGALIRVLQRLKRRVR